MYKTIKHLLSLALLALVVACGGGGGTTTTYQIVFSGTVTGLPSGQQLVLLGSIPATGQSVPITINANGSFSTQITLPSGYNFSNVGLGTVVVSQQPNVGKCSVSYVSTTAIAVDCATVVGAAGLYVGTITTPTISTGAGEMFIANDGKYFLAVGNYNSTTNTTTYSGMITGTGSSASNLFSSNNGVDIFSTPILVNDVVSATFVTLSSFTGTLTENSVNYSLNLTAPPGYSFNSTPSQASITGTYALTLISKSALATISVPINATGQFNGTTSSGCAITGSATPMTTGENAYNFSISFGPSPCDNPSTTQSGSGVLRTTSLGSQLVAGIFNSNRTSGALLIGTKQ